MLYTDGKHLYRSIYSCKHPLQYLDGKLIPLTQDQRELLAARQIIRTPMSITVENIE